MKCDKCERSATFHITELSGDADDSHVSEVHLCEQCATEYLTQPDGSPNTPSLMGAISQQLKVGQTAEELARLDQQSCPVCGITFYEFRQGGRLGCPHDYVCFADDLLPLIMNIHGSAEHTGKTPKRNSGGTDRTTGVIRLRREMQLAVEQEEYERASELRDKIQAIEDESS